jgi:periplasmic divalent cation tolerance protein
MEEFRVVFITCKDTQEAERIAESIVLERLAACANIVPGAVSIFFWEDKLCKESEVLLVIKTRSELYQRLQERIIALHSYKVPEIISLPIREGNPDYLEWVRDSTL